MGDEEIPWKAAWAATATVGGVTFLLFAALAFVAAGVEVPVGATVAGLVPGWLVGRALARRWAGAVSAGHGGYGPLLGLCVMLVGGVTAGIVRVGTDLVWPDPELAAPIPELLFDPMVFLVTIGTVPALLVGWVFTAVVRAPRRWW